jgi:hypothetical protein
VSCYEQPQGQLVIQISKLQMYLNPRYFACAEEGWESRASLPLAQKIATFKMRLLPVEAVSRQLSATAKASYRRGRRERREDRAFVLFALYQSFFSAASAFSAVKDFLASR